MLTRICRIAAIVMVALLAVVGLLGRPSAAMTTVGIAALVVGPLTAVCVHGSRPGRGSPLRIGAGVAALVTVAGLVTAGLITLLGAVALPVILLLIAAVGIWAHRRRHDWAEQMFAPTTPRPDLPGPGETAVPARRRPTHLPLPVRRTGAMSTAELCATWQRTYWLLRDLPATGPDRDVVIDVRRRLLDEFERRDPAGFGRWLQTEPRAGSDPGRYLRAGH